MINRNIKKPSNSVVKRRYSKSHSHKKPRTSNLKWSISKARSNKPKAVLVNGKKPQINLRLSPRPSTMRRYAGRTSSRFANMSSRKKNITLKPSRGRSSRPSMRRRNSNHKPRIMKMGIPRRPPPPIIIRMPKKVDIVKKIVKVKTKPVISSNSMIIISASVALVLCICCCLCGGK